MCLHPHSIKSVSKSFRSTLGCTYDDLPAELYDNDDLDLRLWSVLVSDETLFNLADKNSKRSGRPRTPSAVFNRGSRFNLGTLSTKIIGDGLTFKGVRKLLINGASQITDIGLRAVAVSCGSTLTELDVGRCPNVTDFGLRAIATTTTGLRRLIVERDVLIKGPGLAAIAEVSPNMTELNLSGVKHLESWVFHRIATGCPKLQLLNAYRCVKIDDVVLKAITHRCTDLRELDLGHCKQVSDVGILTLSNNCTNLEKLSVMRNELPFKVRLPLPPPSTSSPPSL